MAAGAALVMIVALPAAQTHAAPGKPMQLLPSVKPPAAAVTKHNVKRRRKRLVKGTTRKPRHSPAAARNEPHQPTDTATAAAPTNVWPPQQTTGSNGFPEAAKPAAPSELVVKGESVQVPPADTVNAIELAADKPKAALASANTAAVPKPMVAALVSAPAPAKTSQVGSVAWIAQVLGALAGAMVTGSLAWLLIGPAPRPSR
ncbi:MAG TPA: hypothetical protein VGJ20_24815 [Xanthobacteraceae bacterium]|jgi:hypothetical protein